MLLCCGIVSHSLSLFHHILQFWISANTIIKLDLLFKQLKIGLASQRGKQMRSAKENTSFSGLLAARSTKMHLFSLTRKPPIYSLKYVVLLKWVISHTLILFSFVLKGTCWRRQPWSFHQLNMKTNCHQTGGGATVSMQVNIWSENTCI